MGSIEIKRVKSSDLSREFIFSANGKLNDHGHILVIDSTIFVKLSDVAFSPQTLVTTIKTLSLGASSGNRSKLSFTIAADVSGFISALVDGNNSVLVDSANKVITSKDTSNG